MKYQIHKGHPGASAFLASLSLLSSLCGSAEAQTLEPIQPDYRNMRGFNYLATYDSLNAPPGTPRPQYNNVDWYGVASSTAMWEYYNPAPGGTSGHVDDQLGWIHAIGGNTVRVFMSLPAYEHNPSAYIARFQHFLGLCQSNGLHCVPVFWDHTGTGAGNPPNYGTYFEPNKFQQWHANPGLPLASNVEQGNAAAIARVTAYVDALCQAASGHPSFLMWDLINESTLPSNVNRALIETTLGVLNTYDDQTVALGGLFALADADINHYTLATHPRIDVHSVHSYWQSRDLLRSLVFDASHVARRPYVDAGTIDNHPSKPVISTEIGSPGLGYSYIDSIDDSLNVRRDDLPGFVPGNPPGNPTGIGFLSYSSNVGWDRGNYPYKKESGVFYPDGTVRDLDVVQAFMQAATAQGVTPPGIPGLVEKVAGPGFVAQGNVVRELDEYAEQEILMLWPGFNFHLLARPTSTESVSDAFVRYLHLRGLFNNIQTGLSAVGFIVYSSFRNGNPYTSATPPNGTMDSAKRDDLIGVAGEIALTPLGASGAPNLFASTPVIDWIEALPFGPIFDPINNPIHLELHAGFSMTLWRNALVDSFLLQSDNSDL